MAIDCLVIGGGVIGLTAAWRLAQRGLSVQVVDQSRPGQEASWAGAGILPPAAIAEPLGWLNQLTAQTNALWPALSRELQGLTGIDNEFQRCGAIELPDEAGTAFADCQNWQAAGAEAQLLSASDLKHAEPATAGQEAGVLLPDLCQVRNPRHLQALLAACQQAGVQFIEDQAVCGWRMDGNRVEAALTEHSALAAGCFLVTAGAWSGLLLAQAGITVEVVPVRGQIILLNTPPGTLTRVIERGKRYLVPRLDGHVLIGSTEEWAGYEKANTEQGLRDLVEFAEQIVPGLTQFPVEKTWSGLRPAAVRGRPLLGPLPGFENLFVATGHFRTGLQLSPITAALLVQQIFDRTATSWPELLP